MPPAMPSLPALPAHPVQEFAQRVRREMGKVIVGQEQTLEMLLVAILAGGHVLLEGVPGTAKTLAVRTLALLFEAKFARIQFTPDLMPSDILGTNVFDPRTQEFHLKQGPIFAGLVLADEINRTPPKTQSALLEAMEERKVTIDGVSYPLPDPFLVCATQNPIDYEGTYPLPEAQLDRFMLKVLVSYPPEDAERELLGRTQSGFRAAKIGELSLEPLLKEDALARYRALIEAVTVTQPVQDYILQLVRATRSHRHLLMGASPRASITLLLASKAYAALHGRNYVNPDDIQTLSYPLLRHRLILRPDAEHQGISTEKVIESLLQSVPVPR